MRLILARYGVIAVAMTRAIVDVPYVEQRNGRMLISNRPSRSEAFG
jgi:hypothetical protein